MWLSEPEIRNLVKRQNCEQAVLQDPGLQANATEEPTLNAHAFWISLQDCLGGGRQLMERGSLTPISTWGLWSAVKAGLQVTLWTYHKDQSGLRPGPIENLPPSGLGPGSIQVRAAEEVAPMKAFESMLKHGCSLVK